MRGDGSAVGGWELNKKKKSQKKKCGEIRGARDTKEMVGTVATASRCPRNTRIEQRRTQPASLNPDFKRR